MKNKKQAGKSIRRLFTQKENKDNFELLYKHLSQTRFHNGFVLCKGLPDERNRILSFFERDVLIERIQFVDMVNPLIDTMGLQESVADAHEKMGSKKDIFFIYNIEDCIERLKTGERDFLEKLNFIRDFFMRYDSVFVFYMTEWLVKEMIRHALDFYDWMKLTFVFIPEEEKKTSSQTISEFEMRKYSDPQEKIEYLKTQLEKTNDPQRKLPLLEDIGHLYYQIGNYELALKYTIEVLDISKMSPNKRIFELARSYLYLSLIYLAMGQLEKALEFQEKASQIYEQVLDKNHPDLAGSYYNLSLIYSAMGQLEKALEFQEKSLKIREKVLDKNHPDLAGSYNNLSLIYKNTGQLERALEFQKKSLKIREAVLDKNHPDLAASYNNLSLIYSAMGQLEKALLYAEKAVAILQNVFPNGHPNLDKMKRNMESIKR